MKKIFILSVLAVVAVFVTGCASSPKVIESDLTSSQLIQKGQNCYEKSDYKGAIEYFKADIQRYGMDNSVYIEATYEMGHTYNQMKDYRKAYRCFSDILELYENAYPGQLPGGYKKLAEIGMNQIPEKVRAEIESSATTSESAE